MVNRTSNIQLALDLRRGYWLIDAPEVLLPLAEAFLSRATTSREYPALSAGIYGLSDEGTAVPAGDGGEDNVVAVIPVHGPLTKYDTCDTFGTVTIAAKMLEMLEDKSVKGFVLDIDSGGGCSNAVAPLVEAIRKAQNAGKPVIAHADACFSAAYWIASQCDAIYLDNPLSSCGSIGAYAQLLDDSTDGEGRKIVTVYAPESTDKNIAYREALEGKPQKMEEELSALVQEFHHAVKSGRPKLDASAKGVLSGAKFSPFEAQKNGLIDGQMSLDDCIGVVFIRSEYN